MQIREDKRPAQRGVEIVGTPEAIADELTSILEKAYGTDGDEKRKNVHNIAKKIREERDGKNWEDIKAFAQN